MIYFTYIFIILVLYKTVYRIPAGNTRDDNSFLQMRKNFTVISCVLLIVIIAFKDVSVGTDTERYYYHFLYDSAPDWREGNIAGQELGFRYLEYYSQKYGLGWTGYSLLTSMLIVIPMGYFFYKYSDNIFLSFLLYITIGLFSHNMTALRQSLAGAMVLVGIIALFEKKFFFFVIFVIIGYFFHYSAIAALLLGVVPFVKYKNNIQLIILLFVPIIVRLSGDVLFGFVGHYLPQRYEDYESQSYTMNPVLELMWFSILAFGCYSLIKNHKISQSDFRFYLITVLFVSAIELSNHIYIASRLSHYMENVLVAAIPCFIYKFPSSLNRDHVAFCISMLCLLAFFLMLIGSDTLSVSNYRFMTEFY